MKVKNGLSKTCKEIEQTQRNRISKIKRKTKRNTKSHHQVFKCQSVSQSRILIIYSLFAYKIQENIFFYYMCKSPPQFPFLVPRPFSFSTSNITIAFTISSFSNKSAHTKVCSIIVVTYAIEYTLVQTKILQSTSHANVQNTTSMPTVNKRKTL